MSSTYSPSLRIELIGSGDQAGAWGATTDSNFAYVMDTAIAGYQAVTVSSAAQALTYVNGPSSTANLNQAVYAMLSFTGAAAASAIYAPPVPKQYILWNNSSYAITIYNSTVIGNTTAAGTGIALAAGDKIQVWSDGTNFYDVKAQNLTGTLAIAKGGTGQTTANAAFNALAPAQTANRLLKSDGTNTSFAQASLTTDVTGTLPIANGGTNSTATATAGGVGYGTGTAHAYTTAGTSGQALVSAGASAPAFGTLGTTGGGTGLTTAGTAGNVLVSDGTNWTSAAGTTGIPVLNVYTSSGTWTKPALLKAIKVTVIGGGGDGANSLAGGQGSGGNGAGGAGGTSIRIYAASSLSASHPYTVGAAGGASSFGSSPITVITATGGSNGVAGSSSGSANTYNGSVGGAGGVGSSGTLNAAGQAGGAGGTGASAANQCGPGGAGGASSLGGGGLGGIGNTSGGSSGTAGGAYGGGGGGAGGGSSSYLGGAGAAGVVIIEEFY